jgi:DNA-binding CsgD family transcriptional regulator
VWRGGLAVPKRLQADFVGTAGVGPGRVAGQQRPALASGARKLLSALATGEPLERLADSLGVSLATLYTQLYRIRKRLGFETLAQLRTYAKLHADYVAKRESPGMPDPSSARGITG